MTIDLVIAGVGGQGRECFDIAEAMKKAGDRLKVRGFVDDDPSGANLARLTSRGVDFLGDFESLIRRHADARVCLGIGSGSVRRALDARLRQAGLESHVLVHPDCTIGSEVVLEPGAVVFAGARLTTNISVGRHVHINQNVTVGHDSTLCDYVSANPSCAVSGNVVLGEAVTVGAGAVVLQGLHVGANSTVGASACVIYDVDRDVTVKGVPAR